MNGSRAFSVCALRIYVASNAASLFRRQGVGAQQLADDHGVRQVVGLLKQVADQQGDGEEHQQPQLRRA